jgi:RNA polymerase sigma-70 factor (ECF subfamily)
MDNQREGPIVRLFADHARSVKHYLLGIIPKLEVAEDLTQEAFARLQSSSRNNLDSPRGFLFRTARNLALDHLRRVRRVPIDQLDDFTSASLVDEAPSPEELVAARQELAIMRAVILELPPKCRQVFLLVRLEGLSHREVAAEMGMSQTMVRKYLARAVDHIHQRVAMGGR